MASLTTCLKRAGELLPAEDRAAILAAAQEGRAGGLKPGDAGRAAVQAQLDAVRQALEAAEQRMQDAQAGRVQPAQPVAPDAEPVATADAPPAQADAQPPQDRIQAVAAQYPGLQVMLDGMDAPMPMADFLAAVQREADAEVAGAPDLMDAATCALLNGAG